VRAVVLAGFFGLEEFMAIRTTVIGSWWKLPDWEAELDRYHRGELSEEEGLQLLDRCAEWAIREQVDLGLDEWSGGEYWSYNFINHIPELISGTEIVKPASPEIVDYGDIALTRVVGEISCPSGMGYAAAFKRESQLPGGVTKAAVIGPVELLAHAMVHSSDEVFRQMPAIVEIVNAEVREIADGGCPHVVLDCPALAINVNTGSMSAEQAAELVAQSFEGVTGCKRGIHMCNGNLMGKPASGTLRIAPWVEVLQRLDGVIDIASLECSYFSQQLEEDSLRDLPPSMEFAAGVVDEKSYWIESVDKIRERVTAWARVVGEERLWLSATCGFGRHPARDTDVLRAKMTNMVAAAQSF
jgi:methionine synthase II (cobalamin-independent)